MRYGVCSTVERKMLDKISSYLREYDSSQRYQQRLGALYTNISVKYRAGEISAWEFRKARRLLKGFGEIKL